MANAIRALLGLLFSDETLFAIVGFLVMAGGFVFVFVVSMAVLKQKESLLKRHEYVKDKPKKQVLAQTVFPPYEPVKSRTHKHPGDLGKSEKVTPYVGSLGAIEDEGCAEHATIRFITPESVDENDNTDYDQIAKAIIVGEALANPKYKTRYRH